MRKLRCDGDHTHNKQRASAHNLLGFKKTKDRRPPEAVADLRVARGGAGIQRESSDFAGLFPTTTAGRVLSQRTRQAKNAGGSPRREQLKRGADYSPSGDHLRTIRRAEALTALVNGQNAYRVAYPKAKKKRWRRRSGIAFRRPNTMPFLKITTSQRLLHQLIARRIDSLEASFLHLLNATPGPSPFVGMQLPCQPNPSPP
jgi:hypothetical protein